MLITICYLIPSKVKEKIPHLQREKTEIGAPNVSVDKSCSCGSEISNNSESACSNCGKTRDVSTCQRLVSNQIINATTNDKQNITNNVSSLKVRMNNLFTIVGIY